MAITVIIPVYNAASTVALAIRSSLRALGPDDRCIVYDDRSTDGTASVLGTLHDERLVRFRGTENVGVAAALNLCLEKVETDLVARMDADDVVIPGRFLEQAAFLEEADYDLVFSSRLNFGSRPGCFKQEAFFSCSSELLRWSMAVVNPIAHSTVLAKTSVLRAAGGYRPGPAEDYDLWMRLVASRHRIAGMCKPHVLYRVHAGQVTKGKSWMDSYQSCSNLRSAHDDLISHLGWRGGSVFATTYSELGDAKRTRAEFGKFVIENSRSALSGIERRRLSKMLARLRWV